MLFLDNLDANFSVYYPLLSQALLDVFHLLPVIFPWKIQQLRAGWLSPSTDGLWLWCFQRWEHWPLHGGRYKCVGISITDRGYDLLLGHPQSDHSLQLLQITSSRVYISVMLSAHQMEGFIFTRLISTLLIHEKKHSYITGQTSIIFQFEEHFLEGG